MLGYFQYHAFKWLMSQENKVRGEKHLKWKNPVQTFLSDLDLWLLLFTYYYNGRLQDDFC